MKHKYSKKNKKYKKKSRKHSGGAETTQGCNNCPASNPTMDELAWNNRYNYGKNTASGWQGQCTKGGKKTKKGGGETTQGCPNCPASNPTMDELAWNNRYVYGNNTASGWGGCCTKGGKKYKKSKKKNTYKKIDALIRNYYKDKFGLNY